MKKLYYSSLLSISFLLTPVQTVLSQELIEQNITQYKDTQETKHSAGILTGRVFANSTDVSNIIIQVLGTNIQVSPNTDGTFNLPQVLPENSSVILKVFDPSGVYYQQFIKAWIAPTDRSNNYQINLGLKVTDFKKFFPSQDLNNSIYCVDLALGLSDTLNFKMKLTNPSFGSSYDSKPFLNNVTNDNLIPSTQCFSNIIKSPSPFYLELKSDSGLYRNYPVNISQSTSLSNEYLSLRSSVYRPIEFLSFTLDQNNPWKKQKASLWLSTSPSYNEIETSISTPIYFPAEQEFTIINITQPSDNLYSFILEPRSVLFNSNLLALAHQSFKPGDEFVANYSPLIIRTVPIEKLANDNQKLKNILQSIENQQTGSLFLDLDLSQLSNNIISNQIDFVLIGQDDFTTKFSRINLSDSQNTNRLDSFLYNIPEGIYQLLITDKNNNQIIGAYIVQSLPFSMQIVSNATNDAESLEVKESQKNLPDSYMTNYYENRSLTLPEVKSLDDLASQKTKTDLNYEKMLKERRLEFLKLENSWNNLSTTDPEKNIIYRLNLDDLCTIKAQPINPTKKFMGFVPQIVDL